MSVRARAFPRSHLEPWPPAGARAYTGGMGWILLVPGTVAAMWLGYRIVRWVPQPHDTFIHWLSTWRVWS